MYSRLLVSVSTVMFVASSVLGIANADVSTDPGLLTNAQRLARGLTPASPAKLAQLRALGQGSPTSGMNQQQTLE